MVEVGEGWHGVEKPSARDKLSFRGRRSRRDSPPLSSGEAEGRKDPGEAL